MTDRREEIIRDVIEVTASALQTGAHLARGLAVPVLEGLAALARAIEVAMRDHGKSVEEIVHAIKMPRKLDTSSRDDIDERIREKPEKG